MKTFDVLIVGGGLAGCAVAWQCRLRGLDSFMVDYPREDSASRVAAGLVTPITGSRFAVSWRWLEFFPVADTLYRKAEAETGRSFWGVSPAWRAFVSDEEAFFWERKCQEQGGLFAESKIQIERMVATDGSPWGSLPSPLAVCGGMTMHPAARLDVPLYLDATRGKFAQDGLLASVDLDVDTELQPVADRVEIPSLGYAARNVVLCQGVRSRAYRWFSELPLHPARGDILQVRSRRLVSDHVLHHQGWIVPLAGDEYLVGATYDRHAFSTDIRDSIAERYREELCRRWTMMTGEEFGPEGAEILQHRIAVRPASYDRHPLIGDHARCPRIWCLNGLGSKGSLMAPRLASHLIDAMLGRSPIDSSLVWSRRTKVG